jgi:hypothetical protein
MMIQRNNQWASEERARLQNLVGAADELAPVDRVMTGKVTLDGECYGGGHTHVCECAKCEPVGTPEERTVAQHWMEARAARQGEYEGLVLCSHDVTDLELGNHDYKECFCRGEYGV